MTVLKLALANLGMWVRERYFPATYAHATWHRLVPFFRLPGRMTQGKQTLWVELRPFNDRQLNRDLQVVCERVAAAQPRLPDGRRLRFTISAGSEAFLQTARIDLDKACETAGKKTTSGSGGAASLLIGNSREPLRLTLDTSTLKKLHSLIRHGLSQVRWSTLPSGVKPWGCVVN